MAERDQALDMALRLLAPAEHDPAEDDRWSKRVAAAALAGRGSGAGASEASKLLEAPLPDDYEDEDAPEEERVKHDARHGDDAASAADEGEGDGEGREWPGSISTSSSTSHSDPLADAPSAPVDPMAGLARLARSGPHPTLRAPLPSEPLDGDAIGAAKADDSGLIDLAKMTAPPPEVAPVAASAAPDPLAVTKPQGPAAKSARAAVAAPIAIEKAPVSMPPSTTQGQTASVASPTSASRDGRKRSPVVVYLTFGGLLAAAATALFFIQPKHDAPSSASGAQPTVAMTSSATAKDTSTAPSPAITAPTVAANAADSASAVADPADTVAIATTTAPPGATMGGSKSAPPATATTTGTSNAPPTKTSAAATTTVAPKPTSDPIGKPSGGSLDDVLGLGKPAPATTSTVSVPDLPDKPDNGDVRSAINSRVGAAGACVKGLDSPSKVTVSFSPAGTVAGVVVTSGPAKGTGAEACIKGAFASAKVPRSKMGATGYASLLP